MKWKQFLKPDWRKIVLIIVIFLFFIVYGSPMCIDPSEEGWRTNPDPEYWGCHSMWHRHFHFIPDWPFYDPGISFLVFAYLISCLIIWIYDKYKKKRIR